VLFSAHTFSTRTELGNVLLKQLDAGDLVVVKGEAGQTLCYRTGNGPKLVAPAAYPALVYRWEVSSKAVFTVCSNYDPVTGVWR
ncbi:hypothetical protein, partial [Escherichia coli]